METPVPEETLPSQQESNLIEGDKVQEEKKEKPEGAKEGIPSHG